jgi:hypothetical protein
MNSYLWVSDGRRLELFFGRKRFIRVQLIAYWRNSDKRRLRHAFPGSIPHSNRKGLHFPLQYSQFVCGLSDSQLLSTAGNFGL